MKNANIKTERGNEQKVEKRNKQHFVRNMLFTLLVLGTLVNGVSASPDCNGGTDNNCCRTTGNFTSTDPWYDCTYDSYFESAWEQMSALGFKKRYMFSLFFSSVKMYS